jgi:hypothetical protein
MMQLRVKVSIWEGGGRGRGGVGGYSYQFSDCFHTDDALLR